MNYNCEECETIFSETDCLCEDWRDPKKSFGCPNCGTFYIPGPDKDKTKRWVDGIFAGGIMVPVFLLLGNAIKNGDASSMFLCATIIFSGLIVMVLKDYKYLGTMEKSGHKVTTNSHDATTGI